MRIRVELQTYLARYAPDGAQAFELEVPQGATVRSIIRRLDIPEEMAGVIVVNGQSEELETALNVGDRVTLIPPLSGG